VEAFRKERDDAPAALFGSGYGAQAVAAARRYA
jgi:hypothetical protein